MGSVLVQIIEQLRNRCGCRQTFIQASAMCSDSSPCFLSPGLVLSCAFLSKPQAAFQECLDYRLPCSEPMEKRAFVAPTSQRVVRFMLIGTLRSLPIIEATTVGQGNEDINGVKPIHSPPSQSRSRCMTETWESASQKQLLLLSQEGSKGWSQTNRKAGHTQDLRIE